MKCGPDGCPILAFSDLTPAEQRVERKRTAEKMQAQGFTQKQIAKQLGVSQNTVSLDLEGSNLSKVDKLKPAKTATNPKGAGRPKGSTKPRKNESITAGVAAAQILDAGKSYSDAEKETGLSNTVLRSAVAREEGRREAGQQVDRASLSMTAQEKLDAAIRQHKRKLDYEFEARVLAECKSRMDAISLPHYAKELEELERSISSRQGIMDRVTYRKILSCLHPDRVHDPALKKRYEEAFRLFTAVEKRLLDEKQSPTAFRKMPRTYEDLMAMKAKVQEERRARRAAGSTPAK